MESATDANQGNLLRLRHHPAQHRIRFNEDLAIFVVDGHTPYSGLLTPLHKIVEQCSHRVTAPIAAPGDVWQWGRYGSSAEHRGDDVVLQKTLHAVVTERPQTAAGLALSGRQHGTIVHRQMCTFIGAYRRFAERSAETPLLAQFMFAVPNPDPCTVALINFCASREWVPFAGEYPVFDAQLGIATSADALFYTLRERRLVLVEFKTGVPTCPRRTVGGRVVALDMPRPLRGAIPPLPVCDFIMHQLQLLCTYTMLRNWDIRVDEAYVVYVTHDGYRGPRGESVAHVEAFPLLPTFAQTYMGPLYVCLLHRKYLLETGTLPLLATAAARRANEHLQPSTLLELRLDDRQGARGSALPPPPAVRARRKPRGRALPRAPSETLPPLTLHAARLNRRRQHTAWQHNRAERHNGHGPQHESPA